MSRTPLTVVPPLAIDDSMLVATDVAEADYPAWSSSTTYAVGQRVMLPWQHTIYESLTAGNLNKPPATSPAEWVLVGPTNRWRLFDNSNSTQTVQTGSMSYTLRPRVAVSTLAALNVTDAFSMRVQMIDPTFGAVYDQTVEFAPVPAASDWYSWFFSERLGRRSTVGILTDLPLYPDAEIVVDLSGGGDLSVGVLLIGQAQQIGLGVKSGMRLGIVDYSRVETNDFGDTVLVQRAYAKRTSFELLLPREQVDPTIDLLASLRSVPCLWIGNPYYASSVVYGFYKEFEVLIAYRAVADCSLEIRGLT